MTTRLLIACVAGSVAAVVIGCSSASAQTFSEVFSRPGEPLGPLNTTLAVADFNGDGRNDLLAGGPWEYNVAAEDRLTKAPLRLFVAVEEDGKFRHAPELIEGTIDARSAIVVADDFNGDGRADLAVFDAGVYVVEESVGVGNPPQLFLSGPDGRLHPSEALAEAVRREHMLRFPRYGREPSGPADLHLKSATSGDIDGDGDIDLWVDSIGGANVSSHFMVNNGDGTFTLDEDRAPTALRYNPPPESWYLLEGHLVDIDNDGDLDLSLAQNRGMHPTTINQSSIVLINDGTGHYPARIVMPQPAFADGFTSVRGQTHFDVNADGFQDLLIVHPRNDDGSPDVIPWTGRYIQVLINDGGMSFVDETTTWIGEQSAIAAALSGKGDHLYNAAAPRMHDVDGDGCLDLVMSGGFEILTESIEAPIVYRNNGSGQFEAMYPEPFASHYGGWYNAEPTDLNNDTKADFVNFWYSVGADGLDETPDDVPEILALLNTTPAGPVRCSPRVKGVGTLPARTLSASGEPVTISLAAVFRDASDYQASSSVPSVAAVAVSGSDLMIRPVAAGVAMVTVTANGADNSIVVRRFMVTVTAATQG